MAREVEEVEKLLPPSDKVSGFQSLVGWPLSPWGMFWFLPKESADTPVCPTMGFQTDPPLLSLHFHICEMGSYTPKEGTRAR